MIPDNRHKAWFKTLINGEYICSSLVENILDLDQDTRNGNAGSPLTQNGVRS